MKMVDREKVDGTQVSIGRRVIKRTRPDGGREERAYRSYTAEYKDANGRWVSEGLGTSNKAAARRKAIEIAGRIESGTPRARDPRITIDALIDRYLEFHAAKGLAPKSMSKYTADLAKLQAYCAANGPMLATRFVERDFFPFKQWLEGQSHKQGTTYANKTCYTTLTIVKQLFKWGWRSGLTPGYALAGVSLPSAKAKPQPCFTAEQVEAMLEAADEREWAVFGVLAYTGMRVNELVQLRWEDVLLDRGELGVLHIRRGGFSDQPKDKD